MTVTVYRTTTSNVPIVYFLMTIPDIWIGLVSWSGAMTEEMQSFTGGIIDPVIPSKGDRYSYRKPDDSDYGEAAADLYIVVNRVARDGTWADIRCCTWAVSWTRRMPLPFPPGTVRHNWTMQDLEAQQKAWEESEWQPGE